jgi:hypothetical protein
MTSPFDLAPEENRPQASHGADPRERRTVRPPASGPRPPTRADLTESNHRAAVPTPPPQTGRHASHAAPVDRGASAGRAASAWPDPVSRGPAPPGPTEPRPRQERSTTQGAPPPQVPRHARPVLPGPRASGSIDPDPRARSHPPVAPDARTVPDPRVAPGRRSDLEHRVDFGARTTPRPRGEAEMIDDDLDDDGSSGRHRLPVSSARQTAAALASGLLYVLTAGRAGGGDARRTLGRPRFLRRGGAA